MSCHFPVKAWRSKLGKNVETGKWPITTNRKDAFLDLEVIRPCGKCLGCRLDYSRAKAVRALHESTLHDANSFVTLTYSPENLPYKPGGIAPTIVKRDHQLFLKRLRRLIEPVKIRYMGCAEYGDDTERPHYHDIIFGYDFRDDRELFSSGKHKLYTSALLSKAWPHGHAVIGDVTFDSAAYVASYTVKKLNGEMAREKYEAFGREPPCGFMSLKPAIGREFIEKYAQDIYLNDSVIVNGYEQRPPRYYDKFFESNGGDLAEVLRRRRKLAEERLDRNIVAFGATRELVLNSKILQKSAKL